MATAIAGGPLGPLKITSRVGEGWMGKNMSFRSSNSRGTVYPASLSLCSPVSQEETTAQSTRQVCAGRKGRWERHMDPRL